MADLTSVVVLLNLVAAPAGAADRYDPYAKVVRGPIVVDMEAVLADPSRHISAPVVQPDLAALRDPPPRAPSSPGPGLPPGWVQIGEVVQREEVALGLRQVEPRAAPEFEDIEGNQYPRKGTIFLNFNGGEIYLADDNSAENHSVLADTNPYPVWDAGEAAALAVVQAVQEDMAELGVRIVYKSRPHKTVPYTMAMVSGDWTDTNLTKPAGGVAPGTDCEDRDQRNVVYAFDRQASTVSQELAHAWGLDHTLGSDRIMSYQGGLNKKFGDNCQTLCEELCQGKGSIGCRPIHDLYCGEGAEQQNDLAELHKVFGTNEPDTEPPTVEIISPAEEVVDVPSGGSIDLIPEIHDNYGGVGWRLEITRDGEVVYDKVDYDRVGSWMLQGLPDGVYEAVVEAEDHADHIVQDRVTIRVGDVAQATTGDPTGTGGPDTTGEGSSTGTGTGSATGGEAESGGCECSAQGQGAAGALWLPLAGLAALRAGRRRRARGVPPSA